MKFSLKVKLSLSYVLVAALLVTAISVMANIFLQRQFANYVMRRQEERNTELVTLLAGGYNISKGSWNHQTLESLGMSALEQGMIVRVTSSDGVVEWDATTHNSGLCNQMIANMAKNMSSRYPNINGGYEEKSYELRQHGTSIGRVVIGYYGPFYFSDADSAYLGALNRILITVGLASLVVALLVGLLMARRISDPITHAITAAQTISRGDYSSRIKEGSTTAELDQLVTAVNQLADNLQRQEELRKRLTGDVAHELRTPLATLQSHIEAFIDGVWQPDRQHFVSCHEEILRMNRLVGDLERLTSLENDPTPLKKEWVDLRQLAGSAIDFFATEAAMKEVQIQLLGGSATVQGDRDKLSQVIINLLSNALKYVPQGGQINVTLSGSDTIITLEVSDNGPGVPPQHLPYIFERFYRADASRNRGTGGSGIGLAIVKAIVERHGGSVTAQNNRQGGASFLVVLPRPGR